MDSGGYPCGSADQLRIWDASDEDVAKQIGRRRQRDYLPAVTAGVTLWGIYGVSLGDLVIIGANVVTLATLIVALTLYYWTRIAMARDDLA